MIGIRRFTRAGRIARAAVVLLIACTLSTACQVEDEARRLNREGNEAYDAGDYQGALDLYRRAQVESPDDAAYIYNGGNTLHRLGQFERAVPESQRAATNGPDDVRFRAYYALGNHYVRLEKLREARDAYKNALKLLPSDMDAKFNLVVVQRRLDEQHQQLEQ
ncbi:MAG: tetratricopeptide repeat protein, partial [Dehalococcoidia bacterium]